MISAFGVEHGEISKGLPSAVRGGGGGLTGNLMRGKNAAGKRGAVDTGKLYKESIRDIHINANANRVHRGKDSRRLRAGLLNEDSAARRAGFKTGKTSALNRGYRGRVSNKMERLP